MQRGLKKLSAGVRPIWVIIVSGHESADTTDNVRLQVPGARLMTISVATSNFLHFEDNFKGAFLSKVVGSYEALASDKDAQEEAMDTMCSS